MNVGQCQTIINLNVYSHSPIRINLIKKEKEFIKKSVKTKEKGDQFKPSFLILTSLKPTTLYIYGVDVGRVGNPHLDNEMWDEVIREGTLYTASNADQGDLDDDC